MPSGLGMASVINLSLLTSRPQGKLRTSEDQIHLIERCTARSDKTDLRSSILLFDPRCQKCQKSLQQHAQATGHARCTGNSRKQQKRHCSPLFSVIFWPEALLLAP